MKLINKFPYLSIVSDKTIVRDVCNKKQKVIFLISFWIRVKDQDCQKLGILLHPLMSQPG